MKTTKIFKITILTILTILINGCSKKTDEDLNPNLRSFSVVCDALNDASSSTVEYRLSFTSVALNTGYASVYKTESEADVSTNTFNLNGSSVSYSYSVTERKGTISSSTTKAYTGKLNESAFVKNQKNRITIIRNGSEWELLVNGKNEDVITGGNGGTGGIGSVGTTTKLYDNDVIGSRGVMKLITVTLPASVKTMVVQTNEPQTYYRNLADLFVRKGLAPTVSLSPSYSWKADYYSMTPNRQIKNCTISNPSSGTWYIGLYGYSMDYHSRLVITITK